MGPYSRDAGRLLVIALVAVAIGLILPAYAKVVAKCAERGVELSPLAHVGLFAGLVLAAVAAVVLFVVVMGAIGWAVERVIARVRAIGRRRS